MFLPILAEAVLQDSVLKSSIGLPVPLLEMKETVLDHGFFLCLFFRLAAPNTG
jgi:hypothetical protein